MPVQLSDAQLAERLSPLLPKVRQELRIGVVLLVIGAVRLLQALVGNDANSDELIAIGVAGGAVGVGTLAGVLMNGALSRVRHPKMLEDVTTVDVSGAPLVHSRAEFAAIILALIVVVIVFSPAGAAGAFAVAVVTSVDSARAIRAASDTERRSGCVLYLDAGQGSIWARLRAVREVYAVPVPEAP